MFKLQKQFVMAILACHLDYIWNYPNGWAQLGGSFSLMKSFEEARPTSNLNI